MRKLRNNVFAIDISVFAFANNCTHIEASTVNASLADIFDVSGGGSLNNVDVMRIDSNGNVTFSTYTANGVNIAHTTISSQGVATHTADITITNTGDVNFGSLTVAQSTTNTTQTGQGNVYTAFLASGPASGAGTSIASLEGSVICSTTVQQNNQITVVVCPPTFNASTWIGVADAAASTGTVINILTAGAWSLAQTTATVNPGDMLIVSAKSQGFLEATTLSTNSIVGVALAPGNANGGLTKVRLR